MERKSSKLYEKEGSLLMVGDPEEEEEEAVEAGEGERLLLARGRERWGEGTVWMFMGWRELARMAETRPSA